DPLFKKRFSISARSEAWSPTVCETYFALENGETAISGTRTPSWSKAAQRAGNGPLGSLARAGQSRSASLRVVSLVLTKFQEHSAPPPGRKWKVGSESSSHCPGKPPPGVRAPFCGALGGLAWS